MTDGPVVTLLEEAVGRLSAVDDGSYGVWSDLFEVYESHRFDGVPLDCAAVRDVRDRLPAFLTAVSGAMGALDELLKEHDR